MYVISTVPILFLLGSVTYAFHDCIPIVNTTSGRIRGFSPYPAVHAYLGMPYAESPIGDLRFEPPQPYILKNREVKDASQLFPGCYQVLYDTALGDKSVGTRESEDCLLINVWKNSKVSTRNLRPVMVWIYGGGFSQGASTPNDGTGFVAEQKDIIFVSFNYRINIFGFPNGDAIKRKNVGLLDQRLAIEWVRDNIEAFGGDPKRITLIGQSAGSISVAYYAFAYPNDPIISGMIMLSGQPESSIRDEGTSWAKTANETRCANATSPATELECMKNVPARSLKHGLSLSNMIKYGDLPGGTPSPDNITVFTREEYVQRGLAGEFARIPIWASHTEHEGDNLVIFNSTLPAPYAINHTEADYITIGAFQCPVSLATLYRVRQGIPAYRTLYSGIFPSLQPYPWLRAYHAADAYLLFGAERLIGWQEVGPKVTEAGKYFRRAVAVFVKDPKQGLTREMGWPAYNATGNSLVRLFDGHGNTGVTFENVTEFDAICENLYRSET